jgi:hypothetical protein
MKYNVILFGKSKFDAGNVFSSMLICFLSLLSEMMQKQSIMLLLLLETFDRRWSVYSSHLFKESAENLYLVRFSIAAYVVCYLQKERNCRSFEDVLVMPESIAALCAW